MSNPAHVQNRLQIRGLSYTQEQLESLAKKYAEDTAVILGQRPSAEGIGYEKVILIVRGGQAVTIMCRRATQNFQPQNFGVKRVVTL